MGLAFSNPQYTADFDDPRPDSPRTRPASAPAPPSSRPIYAHHEDQFFHTPIDTGTLCATDPSSAILDTGDVLLFQGHGFNSWLVQMCTWCRYSHCAMIVRGSDVGFQSDELLVLESVHSADDQPCLLTGARRPGVRIISLRDRLRLYQHASRSGWACTCVIKLGIAQGLRAQCLAALRLLVMRVCGMPYDSSLLHGVGEILPRCIPPELETHLKVIGDNPVHSLNCSELVALALVQMGVMRKGETHSRTFTPRTFAYAEYYEHSIFNHRIGWLEPGRLHIYVSESSSEADEPAQRLDLLPRPNKDIDEELGLPL